MARGNAKNADSGIQVSGDSAVDTATQELTPVRPTGMKEFLLWYVPLAKQGKTTAELVEAYPGDITGPSFSAKLSKVIKEAEAKGIKNIPRPKRARGNRGEAFNAADLAKELNLDFAVEDETEEVSA